MSPIQGMHLCSPCHVYEKQWPDDSCVAEEVHSYLSLGHLRWKSGIWAKICKLFDNCHVKRTVYVSVLKKPNRCPVPISARDVAFPGSPRDVLLQHPPLPLFAAGLVGASSCCLSLLAPASELPITSPPTPMREQNANSYQ